MDSAVTLIGLPVALGIIMLGLGLGLTMADFRRVAHHPRAAVIALVLARPLERLSGVYLAIVSISFVGLIQILAVNLESLTGGATREHA